MDDFDRLLEFHLRRKLGAVVSATPPARRVRPGSARLIDGTKKMGYVSIELRPDMLVFVEHS